MIDGALVPLPPIDQPEPALPAAVPQDDPDPPPGGLVRLNDPEGQHASGALNGEDALRLEGRIGLLEVDSINGRASLDAAALSARQIALRGAVNGETVLVLRAPGGTVEATGDGINGSPRIRIDAPGGKVVFRENMQIQGQAELQVTAREVAFHGPIQGAARIEVTLTEGGRLSYREVGGGACLRYRSAKQGAAQPVVEAGTVRAGATVEELPSP
jgi:hypothetical protein